MLARAILLLLGGGQNAIHSRFDTDRAGRVGGVPLTLVRPKILDFGRDLYLVQLYMRPENYPCPKPPQGVQ